MLASAAPAWQPAAMEQRSAIVTGGGRGIGFAVAEALVLAGYQVCVAERDAKLVREAESRLARHGAVIALRADVSREADVKRVVAATVRAFGGLDLLVCNAAIADPRNGPIEKLSLAEWNKRIGVNLSGAFLCAKHAAPALRRRSGAIINVSSTRSLMSEPDCEAYAASKGGLDALTHALAVSLGPDVRVNSIRAGWIETGAAKVSRRADRQHPAGRVGRPADVAGLVLYLASSAARFLTGQALTLDGGMTRKMIYEV